MNRKQYNIILLAGFIAVILFFVVFRLINKSIDKQIAQQVQSIKEEMLSKKVVEIPKQEQKKEERVLISSDLTSYTIVPQRKSNLFKNQQYWDIETRKALMQPGVIGGMQDGGIFNGINRSPDQIKKQIKRIDGRIREYKQRIRNDPTDDYARQKLQDLYMLKSTVKIFSENTVSNY